MIKEEGQNIIGSDRSYDNLERIRITAYEPAFGIIGDPAKRNPKTRQSADHSMAYIIATLLRKSFEKYDQVQEAKDIDDMWKTLMLTPLDYGKQALFNENTKKIMEKIDFNHGGVEYDQKYPEGIPTSVEIRTKSGKIFDSGLVMFPGGHARNDTVSLNEVLKHKFKVLGKLALEKNELIRLKIQLDNIAEMSNEDL
jgi:2-methylcitrate dehydratase